MAYTFKQSDVSVVAGLRRIAASQLQTALSELDDEALTLDERVLQGRKRCKKVRGLIRLVRPVFPDYARENIALRDAARQLSGFRDAGAMVEIMQTLVSSETAGLDAAAQTEMLNVVEVRRETVNDRAVVKALEVFRGEVEKALGRARRWRIEAEGWAAVSGGLVQSHERMRRAMRAAFETPSHETIHDWRKRVKYHWQHARLLREIWPQQMITYGEEAGRLARLIGDYRDFSLLRLELDDIGGDIAEQAMSLAEARQQVIHDEIVSLGRRLAAERPASLARRWGDWWEIWRDGEAKQATLAA